MVQPAQPHSFLRLLLSLLALLFLATPASAGSSRIARSKARLDSRQATGQTSFQTVETSNTPAGVVTQTCTVVLTPVVDGSGADMVEMTKTCTITVTPLNGSQPPPPSTSTSFIGGAPPSTNVPTQPSATDNPPAESSTAGAPPPAETSVTDTPPPAESSSSVAPPPAESTTDGGASSTDSAAVPSDTSVPSDTVAPSVSASAPPSGATPTQPTPTTVETVVPSSVVDIGGGSGPQTTPVAAEANAGPDLAPIGTTMMAASEASLIATAVSANAPASTTTAAATNFELPGQQLQVLPIGLGVFAGVSVIALIVVGLVTYERTKYRKAFRERTMRMQNAGYGSTNAV